MAWMSGCRRAWGGFGGERPTGMVAAGAERQKSKTRRGFGKGRCAGLDQDARPKGVKVEHLLALHSYFSSIIASGLFAGGDVTETLV
jgi:hypothetical protein